MSVAHAACDLHPRLRLVVDIDSGSISPVVGVADDTSVVEVAYASVIVQFVLRSADRQVVFLTE